MLDYLGDVSAGDNISLLEGAKQFCLRNSGKGIVVLISDLMDKTGYESALRFLTAQRMDVFVLHVLSREELDPDVKGDLKLIDCEDGDIAEITASRPLLDKYKQTLASFIDGARNFCARRGAVYITTPVDTPVDEIICKYLRQRGLVR